MSAAAAAAAASGITLDMDWEQMDGIVNLDTLTRNTSVSDLSLTLPTSGILVIGGDTSSGPTTPDSIPASMLYRRRPSLAPTLGAIDSAGESAEGSPHSAYFAAPRSRRASLAPDTGLWGPTSPMSNTPRKTSAGMQSAMLAAAAAAAAYNAANAASAAGWTAPESWAVKADEEMEEGHVADPSDEEAEDLASLGSGGISTPVMKYSEDRRTSVGELGAMSNPPVNGAGHRPSSVGNQPQKRPSTGNTGNLMSKGTNVCYPFL